MQGILQVTYFDIRAAASAKMQLDGYALAEQCLSVQYVTTPGSIGGFTEVHFLPNAKLSLATLGNAGDGQHRSQY